MRVVSLLRGALAPPPRTLVDIFRATMLLAPDEPAIDNGADVLTYEEFAEAAEEVADELASVGVGRGDRVGVRLPSGTSDLYIAIMAVLMAGAPMSRSTPTTPTNAPAWSSTRPTSLPSSAWTWPWSSATRSPRANE